MTPMTGGVPGSAMNKTLRPGGRQFSSFPPALQPVSGFYAAAGRAGEIAAAFPRPSRPSALK
jgi:hypothetical protein